MGTYKTEMDGVVYTVSADWGDAASEVFGGTGGEEFPTGKQVADFRHRPERAMLYIIREDYYDRGDNPDDAKEKIEEAVREME